MNNYPNTGSGLKIMFIAQVCSLICVVIRFIPFIGGLIGGIGAIACLVLIMVGLYSVGKDIEGCKMAFTLTIVNLALNFISIIPIFRSGIFSLILTLANDVCLFLVVYYVCTSVGTALTGIGASDVAEKGQTVWKINLACYVASIVISLLIQIPLINILAAVLSFFVAIVAIVAQIFYMIFLNKSYQAFGA